MCPAASQTKPVPEEARLAPSSTSADEPRAATWTTDGETRSKSAMADVSKSDKEPRGATLRGVVEAYRERSIYGCAAIMTNSTKASARATRPKRDLTGWLQVMSESQPHI